MEQWIFWPTALLSISSALIMLITPNAVHSALALVVNFFTLAVFYVLLDAHFLAAAQVIVYAGAIMVLFLFVIMLLGVDRKDDLGEKIRFQRPIGYALVLGLTVLTVVTLRTAFESKPFGDIAAAQTSGNIEGLGRVLFNSYLFPFEVTSLLLIVAAIGAMVIGKRRPAGSVGPEEDEA